MIWPSYGQTFLQLCASVYPGYHPGTAGSVVIGAIYALLDGVGTNWRIARSWFWPLHSNPEAAGVCLSIGRAAPSVPGQPSLFIYLLTSRGRSRSGGKESASTCGPTPQDSNDPNRDTRRA
jgi:hypothetical protein